MRLLVFQHLACEHPGIFRRFMAEDGVAWDAIELDEGQSIPAFDPYDALIVMGGPMDVWDIDEHAFLIAEKRAIRQWVREWRKPMLGICLGHQLLADALGGTCGPQRPPEVGIMDIELTDEGKTDRLMAGLPLSFKALQWHSVRVAQLPEDGVVLASSPLCRCQAIRVGDRAWGIQYHVEIETTTIPEWGCVPAYKQALEATHGQGGLERMGEDAAPHMADFEANARLLYNNFMGVVRG
jgi:GMP synthase-like glutamine amidotransferase